MQHILFYSVASILLAYTSTANARICNISSYQSLFQAGGRVSVLQEGRLGEYVELMEAGLTKQASTNLACFVRIGTRVYETDYGLTSSTVRILEGDFQGCIGVVPREHLGCDS